MPLAVPLPHLAPNPPPHAPALFARASLTPHPQLPHGAGDSPSTVKGRGSHDGFHRWSVEIAGKRASALWRNKEPESHGEKYGWKKREGWGDKRVGEERRGRAGVERREGEGGVCLKKVPCSRAKSVLV